MKTALALLAALLASLPASAVSLSADGTGQALVFPYYTVRSANGNAFNTYLSIVNHSTTGSVYGTRVSARSTMPLASLGSPAHGQVGQ